MSIIRYIYVSRVDNSSNSLRIVFRFSYIVIFHYFNCEPAARLNYSFTRSMMITVYVLTFTVIVSVSSEFTNKRHKHYKNINQIA